MKENQKPVDRKARNQGMNWIRKERRLAIYLRDGLACCYCGEAIEDGVKLTLDHIDPHSNGGTNDPKNLVTACHRCNSARGNRSVKVFAARVADYLDHSVRASDILRHIATTTIRPLDVQAAKNLIAARGGFVAAMNGGKL